MQIVKTGRSAFVLAGALSFLLLGAWSVGLLDSAVLATSPESGLQRRDGDEGGERQRREGDREGERDEPRDRDRERGEREGDRPRRDREGGEREGGERDRPRRDREGEGPALAHMVFFDVVEDSAEAREQLVAGCREYLSGHRGVVHFSVGAIAEDLKRDVNDQAFDVALHLVFRNRAAHDRYQTHPRHLAFIEKCSKLWERVRVFDSYLRPMRDRTDRERGERREGRGDRDGRVRGLPEGARGFAGMVRGHVRRKLDGGRIVLEVAAVPKVWDPNRAENPEALAGRRVIVVPRGDGDASAVIRRFLASLPENGEVTLDVAHRRGPALVVVELTEEQRRQARRSRREGERERDR